MKFRIKISFGKVLATALLSAVACSGCSGLLRQPASDPEVESFEYRSELADPRAKALYAYGEFRMYGGENRWDEAIEALQKAVAFDPGSDYLQLVLAKAYLHREQPGRAVEILQALLERSPDNGDAHQFLGDVYSYLKKYPEAIDHFRRALELSPQEDMLQMRLAMALAKVDRRSEAIGILEKLVERVPDAGLARLSLARFYQEEGEKTRAEETYRQLLESNPAMQQAVIEYGRLLEDESPDTARELYEAAIDFNPQAAVVRRQLAQFFLERQQPEEALQQLVAIREQFPGNLQVISQIGLLRLELEHWSEAETDFRLLLSSGVQQDRNHYYLAMAIQSQGRTEEAIGQLEQISENAEIYPEASLQLAYLYKSAGRDGRAVEVLERMVTQGYGHPDVYYYLVAFLGDLENYPRALAYARQGVAENPGDTRLLYQLGVLYEKLDDRPEAVKTMESVLNYDAAHADALNYLAYYQAETGQDLELALERAQKAIEVKPSGYIIDTLGWVYYKLGRYAESLVQLQEAVRLHPDDAVIREHLGDLYRAMGNWADAAEAYRQALENDPQAQHLKEKLENLPVNDQP